MNASKSFVVKRRTWICKPRSEDNQSEEKLLDEVAVAATLRLLREGSGETMCLSQFRKVFGFTPRKGRVYTVTMSEITVVGRCYYE